MMQGQFGVSSMSGRLTSVAMRSPNAILKADHVEWHYEKPLDAEALTQQFDAFAELLSSAGTQILWLSDEEDDLADSIFTYDASFMLPSGAVLLQPGKELRRGEVDLHRKFYDSVGVPILGSVQLPGTFEGGDCFWLDRSTLAVGRGFRSNSEGIAQFDLFGKRRAGAPACLLLTHCGPHGVLFLCHCCLPCPTIYGDDGSRARL